MKTVDWVQLFASVAPSNVNSIWLLFKQVITDTLALFVTVRRLVCRPYHRHKGPVYPFYIRRALRLKLILWRSRHNLDGMTRYTAQAAKCTRLIKKYHLRTERRLLASNNVYAFYKHINNYMSSLQGSVPIRAEDGTIYKTMPIKLVRLMHTSHLFLMTTLIALSLQSVAIIFSSLLIKISLLKSFLRLYKV